VPIQLAHHSSPLGAGDEVFPKDWEPVIEELVSGTRSAAPAPPGSPGTTETPAAVRTFHGRIESIGTHEILKALAQSRASGIVSFETNPQGALLLEDGLIVGASWGELSGAQALAQLLLLEAGTFRVGAHLHEVMTEDSRAPQALMLDALQLVAQARARSQTQDAAGRPLERPSPRAFRLAAPGSSANGGQAAAGTAGNGQRSVAPVASPANGNGNHSNGSGSNGETGAGRFFREILRSTPPNGNHGNGKQTPAEPKAHAAVTSHEQNRPPAAPAAPDPAALAPTEAIAAGPAAEAAVGPPAAAASPRPAAASLPGGQLRSKSLWWIDSQPSAAPRPLESVTFTRRTLDRLRGVGRRGQPQK
jgi:hypothetical protein